MYAFALGAAGFSVAEAADGIEGFDAAVSRRPNLVVTDFVMPRMDGLELCRLLRETEATRQIPVIGVTARVPDLATLQRLHEDGTASVLIKPCEPARLIAEVRQMLERNRVLRERSQAIQRRAKMVQMKSNR